MKKTKRLFLFASYDKDNIVDNTVIYYVNELSKIGDIIFFADNDLPDSEIKKISSIPHVLHTDAKRHGEYDFGSYKRLYTYAKEHKLLAKYDWVYFVNDSVYGPLNDLNPILEKLESSDAGLVGMAENYDKYTPRHVQSWFVGVNNDVITSDFFDKFMSKIKKESQKMYVCLKYEVGLSCTILRHGFKMKTLLSKEENQLYADPRDGLIRGVPFIKKLGIANVCDMAFIYPHADNDILIDYINAHMQRHGIQMARNSYHNVYELQFFKMPLVTIRAKDPDHYKIYLFGKIQIFKVKKD